MQKGTSRYVLSGAVMAALLLATRLPAQTASAAPAGAFDVSSNAALGKGGTVTLHGPSYVPAGATNFTIFALQGIDASHMFGDSGLSPQVNTDFEFTPSIGVTYQAMDKKGKASLTDFGLGLYQDASNNTLSTGLKIMYTVPVFASSVTIRVEDFDIKTTDTFFNNQKVEPSILLLGPNNTIYGSAGPTAIFPNLVSVATTGKGSPDVWDLNFSGLLSTLHLADAPITGFILFADVNDGEKANSDPYLLVSVGNGVQVPEPSSMLLLMGAGGMFLLKRRFSARS